MPLDGSFRDVELGLILSDAADLIERHGWCQKVWSIDERRCVFQAIRDVSGPSFGAAIEFFKRRLDVLNAVAWNDAPERTKEQVIAALRGWPAN